MIEIEEDKLRRFYACLCMAYHNINFIRDEIELHHVDGETNEVTQRLCSMWSKFLEREVGELELLIGFLPDTYNTKDGNKIDDDFLPYRWLHSDGPMEIEWHFYKEED